jgi:PAS domain S-box-containing protein
MKLSKRFLIIPLVLTGFFYLFYSVYKDVRNSTLDEFNVQQFTLAKQASRGIESFFVYYQRELLFLSNLKYVSDLNDQGKELLSDFYNHHSDQIEAITVVDSKGVLIYTYPLNPEAVGKNISNQPHVQSVMTQHKPIVSDVFTSVQGFRTIAYHVPIITGDDYKGSLAILIPLNKLGERFVENIRTGRTGYGWMISEAGIELFNPTLNYTGKSVKEIYSNLPSVINLVNKTLTGTEGTSTCYLPSGKHTGKELVKTLAGFYRIPLGNTFWTIIIFTPEQEIYSKLASFRNRMYILFLLILIVIGTYFFLSLKVSNILKEVERRKAIEITLRESEKRFRIMFELSPAGIILLDDKGTIIEVNTSFCENLGYSKEELIGNNIRFFSLPDKLGDVERNIERILSGETLKHEVSSLRKDGTDCAVTLYETAIRLPDGKQGILSVSNDVTEKKQAQARMLTLSRALEGIGECVSITNHNNKIIFVNNAFCNTYGYKGEEIIGKDISILRSPEYKEFSPEKILSDTINGGWNGELINVRKDGSEFPIELSTSHIKDENGNPIALIGIAVDITDRRRVQQELIHAKEKAEESDRLKSAFLANMSHELRTPLNAIIGFSGLIIDTGPNQDTIPYSQIILKSGQHLLSLVEDIFDITMIETGQLKVNYEKADIISIMEEVRDIMYGERIRENKTGIKINLNLDGVGNQKYLVTDIRKLKQILLNLLKNALKFTDYGSIEYGYTVIDEPEKSIFQFYVRDTGIGIDKKYHNAIFNIFRQIDDTHTRKFGGMGIGLSIAKKTVELLGGKIWVESESSVGSVFYFTIPVLPDKEKKDSKEGVKVKIMAKNFPGKTILIAEDEESNFDFMKILLTRMKIRVLWAKNGREAVNLCETDPSIDLVLMDIKMPLLNGYEATKLIKLKRPDLPVIAQTAYAMISDKQEADEAGCNGYLSKPIKINQITEILESFL